MVLFTYVMYYSKLFNNVKEVQTQVRNLKSNGQGYTLEDLDKLSVKLKKINIMKKAYIIIYFTHASFGIYDLLKRGHKIFEANSEIMANENRELAKHMD